MSNAADNEHIEGQEPIDPVLLERMQAALLTLPRFTREVFLAHRLDDLSYGEIARITGTSVQRVEREIARAVFGLTRAMSSDPPRAKRLRIWRW